jgi:hypothetical protein
MVYFHTKNPILCKFWRDLELKMLLYFMTIWNILWPFDIIYGIVCGHLVYSSHFSMYGPRKKSGNPA